MNDLLLKILYFYFLIFLGTILGKIFIKYNSFIRKALTFILLYILTPPLIIFAFILPNITLTIEIIIIIIIFEIILVFSTQSVAYIFFLKNKSKTENKRIGAILMLVSFPNAVLFPLPLVLYLFGTNYIIILVIFSITATILRIFWLTPLNMHFGKKEPLGFKKGLKEFFAFPPTLALIISIILIMINIKADNDFLINLNDFLAILTTICGALLIGVLLADLKFKDIRGYKKDFFLVLGIRVIFSFLLFFALILLFPFPKFIQTQASVILLLIFVDPPAVSNTIYANYFELDDNFAAFCVIAITLLAIFYIPLILILGLMIF
ncbi:MAG: hypothetical protein ACTSQP_06480 [Promethearchaeota archaeon]